jgi:hypothetical protein
MIEHQVKYRDFPLAEVVAKANELIAGGATVYQKYTCRGCGARLTIDKPNVFHVSGGCDKCPAITDIRAAGCNYMVILGRHR